MPSTRNRYRLLAGALLCLLVLVALTVFYKTDVRVLDELDNDLGAGPQGWTFRRPAAQQFLLFVEAGVHHAADDDLHRDRRPACCSGASTHGPRCGRSW